MCFSFHSFRERNSAKGRCAATAGAVIIWAVSLLAEIAEGSGVVPLQITISIAKALARVISVSLDVNPVTNR
jgi:hypothetical protein